MTNLTPEKLASLREAIAALQSAHYKVNASCFDSPLAAYIAAADPKTVLALVEEVERLRDIETDLLVCDADCRDLQALVAELRDSNAKVTDARDNLLDEVGRLQARVAELEAAMAQRMGVYAAPQDERQVGS